MGYDFTKGASKKDIVAYLIGSWTGEESSTVTLKSKVIGNVLWTVRKTVRSNEETLWIGCDLLENQRGYGWGYKAMDESVGPCYYTCPLEYLDIVPPSTSPYSAGWRDDVRSYHAGVNVPRGTIRTKRGG